MPSAATKRWRFDWGWAHGIVVGATVEFDGVMVCLGLVWFTVEREVSYPWP